MVDAHNLDGSWIGRSVPRSEVGRLITGRGRYTDDIAVANVGHVAFLRSPHAHARIESIDAAAAKAAPGVIAIVTADDLMPVCQPWQTRLALIKSHISPPQFPLASKEACWQGEAVVAVVAETRAQAEDAVTLINVRWAELPAIRPAGVPPRSSSTTLSSRGKPELPWKRAQSSRSSTLA